MKKRVLAVILGAVMTMSLAACGSSDAGKRPGSDGTSGTDGSAYRPAGKCAEAGGKDSGK